MHVDVVTTEGEAGVTANLTRKQEAAERMFSQLIAEMNQAQIVKQTNNRNIETTVPSWL